MIFIDFLITKEIDSLESISLYVLNWTNHLKYHEYSRIFDFLIILVMVIRNMYQLPDHLLYVFLPQLLHFQNEIISRHRYPFDSH